MNSIQKRQITAYYLSFFSFGLILSIIGTALPYLAEHTGVSLSRMSLIFTMSSIGFFVGSILNGRLFDKLPGNIILFVGWCMAALGVFFIPVISSFTLLCAVSMAYSFGCSSIIIGCNTLIIRVHRSHVGPLMNGMHVVNGIGAFLTPLIFSFVIARTGDVVQAYRLYAILFVVVGLYVITTPSPAWQDRREKRSTLSGGSAPTNPVVILLVLTILIYVGSEISFNGWIYTYIKTLFPEAARQAGYVLSVFWGCMTAGRVVSIFSVRRFSPGKLLVFNFIGAGAGLLVIVIGSAYLQAVWMGTIITGFAMGSTFPLLLTYGEETIGLTGKLNGIIFSGIAVGGMIFPFVNGQFFTRISPNATMLSIVVSLTAALMLFILTQAITTRHKRQTSQEL